MRLYLDEEELFGWILWTGLDSSYLLPGFMDNLVGSKRRGDFCEGLGQYEDIPNLTDISFGELGCDTLFVLRLKSWMMHCFFILELQELRWRVQRGGYVGPFNARRRTLNRVTSSERLGFTKTFWINLHRKVYKESCI